jgi:hypothetical protein
MLFVNLFADGDALVETIPIMLGDLDGQGNAYRCRPCLPSTTLTAARAVRSA